MFEYVDRIFRIVRPRQLLYIAIDGVAPRAKLNQQRSRRFRSAKDAEIAEAEEERLRQEFERADKKVLPKEEYEVSDSTVITPGTLFMQRLSKALEFYIRSRLNSDPGWKKIKVILSDSNVPGEGEHKIISFIRLQRASQGYDPNTRHCLYGLDADLIMLALATHEIHFFILREDIVKPNTVFETNLFRKEFNMVKPRGWCPRVNTKKDGYRKKPYQGAIDLLITVYKKMFKKMGGYIIDASKIKDNKVTYVKRKRLEQFISEIGSHEDRIFEKRYQLQQKKIKRWFRENLKEDVQDDFDDMGENLSAAFSKQCSTSEEDDVTKNTIELKQKLKALLRDKEDLFKNGVFENDKVKLGIPGWKCRYYKEKFSAETPVQIEETGKEIVEKYMEGLCWILQYYFAGVCSWGWYYPFHYGPFASDLKGLSRVNIKFNLGFPLKPFDQLMAVLPPRSSNALPKAYRQLVSSDDSVIKKFYPTDFVVDMNGKRFAWQGVAKLPFIEEVSLQEETKKKERELGINEVERNQFKNDKILVGDSPLGSEISSIYKSSEPIFERTEKKYPIDMTRCKLSGYLTLCHGASDNCYSSPIEEKKDVTEDHVRSAIFMNPDYCDHIPKLLANVTEPEKTITEADIVERKLWHEYEGPHPPSNIRPQRYVPREEDTSYRVSAASAREIHKGAGSGWGGRGKGKELEGSSYTGRGHINSGGNLARGMEGRGQFGCHPDTYRGNHESNLSQRGRGRGFNLNMSYGGYHTRNGGFRQPANRLPDGRSENWPYESSPMIADRGRGCGPRGRTNAEPNRCNQYWRTKQ